MDYNTLKKLNSLNEQINKTDYAIKKLGDFVNYANVQGDDKMMIMIGTERIFVDKIYVISMLSYVQSLQLNCLENLKKQFAVL